MASEAIVYKNLLDQYLEALDKNESVNITDLLSRCPQEYRANLEKEIKIAQAIFKTGRQNFERDQELYEEIMNEKQEISSSSYQMLEEKAKLIIEKARNEIHESIKQEKAVREPIFEKFSLPIKLPNISVFTLAAAHWGENDREYDWHIEEKEDAHLTKLGLNSKYILSWKPAGQEQEYRQLRIRIEPLDSKERFRIKITCMVDGIIFAQDIASNIKPFADFYNLESNINLEFERLNDLQ